MKILEGTGTSGGIAVGRARLLAAPSAVKEDSPGKGTREETRRYREASDAVRQELCRLRERAAEAAGEAEAQIFEIHALLLEDPDFSGEILRLLGGGAPAETAVRRAGEMLAASAPRTSATFPAACFRRSAGEKRGFPERRIRTVPSFWSRTS